MERKLYTLWWFVLLRGLAEAALIFPYFFDHLQDAGTLTIIVGSVALVGGLLEIGMVIWMRGHFFRGILRFIGAASVLFGAFMLWSYPPTIGFVVVMTGLWLVIRGFGVFWLSLSIVERPLDRTVPMVSGLTAIGIGVYAMLWMEPEALPLVRLLGLIGAASALMHFLISIRLFYDRGRARRRQESLSEEHQENASP